MMSRRFPLPLFTALLAAVLALLPAASGQTTTPFSRFIVFGDSLSDTGNVANTTDDTFDISYPSEFFNYADGRFTNGPDTDPNQKDYDGVWHEQLARMLLNLPRARPSTDPDGMNFAFGGATSQDGDEDISVVDNPFGSGELVITIQNMGEQVSDFLRRTPQADPAALYIVWGGGNDLFDDPSAANVTAAAARIPRLVERLARAGGVNFLVPNVPPLGAVPRFRGDRPQADRLNQASADFRVQLSANLDALQGQLGAQGIPLNLYRLDVYDLFLRFAFNPAAYNFENFTDPAQGEPVAAEQSLFWDEIHPTTAGHFQLAAEAYSVLTGIPVVQIAPAKSDIDLRAGEKGIFFLTRTGPDLSTSFSLSYTVGGSAAPGVNYVALPGFKTFAAGRRTTKIKVLTIPARPGDPKRAIKLTLNPQLVNTDVPSSTPIIYRLPIVQTEKINLRTD